MVGLALILTGLLLGNSARASQTSRTTFTISRAHTQVTTEVRAASPAKAELRLAEMAERLRAWPMVRSIDANGNGVLVLRLNPPAAVSIRMQADESTVRVQAQFLRGAGAQLAKPGRYLTKLASVMKAINERLIE